MWDRKSTDSVVDEIQGLNQRGGRMLTAADLLTAGTVDLDLMAYLLRVMSRGASVITCAGPGGTGKTTLLGALLCFLPTNMQLRVVDGPDSFAETDVCYLCHELGQGPYYSYLWGDAARSFLKIAAQPDTRFCATTAHADTLEELREMLVGPAIGLSESAFAHLDLVVFMRRLGGFGRAKRRVTHVYAGTGDVARSHIHVCRWEPEADRFVWQLPDGAGWSETCPYGDILTPYRDFLSRLHTRQVLTVAEVRQEARRFLRKA